METVNPPAKEAWLSVVVASRTGCRKAFVPKPLSLRNKVQSVSQSVSGGGVTQNLT